MKPFRRIDQDDLSETLEFKTLYIYVLYLILAMMTLGVVADISQLFNASAILMGIFFFLVSLPTLPVLRRIREGRRTGCVSHSGRKWSFANPYRVTLPR